MNYYEYIASNEWRKKRKRRLEMDGYKCRLCDEDGSRFHLEVHHRPSSYEKIPNESVRDDLITLCVRCHDLITNAIRGDRNDKKEYKIEPIEANVRQEIKHDLASKEVSIEWIDPVDYAQRPTRSPNKQVGTFDERDYRET